MNQPVFLPVDTNPLAIHADFLLLGIDARPEFSHHLTIHGHTTRGDEFFAIATGTETGSSQNFLEAGAMFVGAGSSSTRHEFQSSSKGGINPSAYRDDVPLASTALCNCINHRAAAQCQQMAVDGFQREKGQGVKKAKADSRKTLAKGKFLQLVRQGRWEIAERVNARGAVAIFALTDQRELILTEQHRVAVNRAVIDVAAGLSGDVAGQENEDFAIAAQRELLEETGFECEHIERVGAGPSSPGLTSEISDYFVATGVRRVSAGGGVEHEQITVHVQPLRTIRRWLAAQVKLGKLIDPKVYAALYYLAKYK